MQNPAASESVIPWIPHVVDRVQALKFGSILIKVHEGQVVVVEVTELTRFQTSTKHNAENPALKAPKKTHSKP